VLWHLSRNTVLLAACMLPRFYFQTPAKDFQRPYAWWTRRRPVTLLSDTLAASRMYEEWEGAAFQLDELHGNDLWYSTTMCAFPSQRN